MLLIFMTFIITSEGPGMENYQEEEEKVTLILCIHSHALSVYLCKHQDRN